MVSNNFNVKRMDHLGLVAGFCKEIGIEAYINEQLPKNSHRSKISNGKLLIAMILNGLGFVSRTLHMYPEYFEDKPVEKLLGTGIKAAHINDDAIGRCLDELYETGVSALYQEIAEKVIKHLKLPCQSINMDTTSFHLDGKYENDLDTQAIRITKGYSRDHRPDLNQVVLQLITENQAGIPLYMQACSGNTNDTTSFKALVKSHVKSLKAAFKNKYLVADAALYDAETLQALDKENQLFITRVPQKIKLAKEVIAKASEIKFSELNNGYAGAWVDSNYGDVKQRWLLIKSKQAQDREQHILKAKIKQSTSQSYKEFKKLCRQEFACETDAMAMLTNWESAQDFVKVYDVVIQTKQKHARRGRPNSTEILDQSYYITGFLATDLQSCKQAANTTGLFILSTNDIKDKLDMQFLLDEYKSQQAVERGFRFLKSPDFLTSSLFLKKPERIEALLMVMTCSLMVYAAIEHLIRTKLVEQNKFFPDMKKKPTQSPTARWVFFCFQGISFLVINNSEEYVTDIIERQKIILNCLGKTYWEFYS